VYAGSSSTHQPEKNVNSAELLIGIAVLMLVSLAVFGVYQWLQIRRRRQVDTWVNDYLNDRYDEMPKDLHINCTNDRLWPVLVDFQAPKTGTRHNLQFNCPGSHSTFSLLSEKEEKWESRVVVSHDQLSL
jgi:hypothetical protein